MRNVVEYVIDGLEAALELERELGVRSIEIDRRLLSVPSPAPSPRQPTTASPAWREARAGRSVGAAEHPPPPAARMPAPSPSPATKRELVFLHDRPLSPGGVAMMAKIITALKRTSENTPIVVAPPIPPARVIVVLGARALKRYFPQLKAGPGQWVRLSGSATDVLITYSPEYILRFGEVTPAVDKLKHEMWRSLKAVVQRLK